jgi:hypothetical protein
MNNISYKLYVYNGIYKVNHYYHLNDFLENPQHNYIFRIQFQKDQKGFLIITDLSFLLFSNCKGMQVKLLYYNELIHFINFDPICQGDTTISNKIKWNKQQDINNIYNEEIFHLSISDYNKINDIIIRNKQRLTKQFCKFIYTNNNPLVNYLEIINYKEGIFDSFVKENKKTKVILTVLNELILLYTKVIEIFSLNGDARYLEYASKLKNALKKENDLNK